jgi:hypothetical protein
MAARGAAAAKAGGAAAACGVSLTCILAFLEQAGGRAALQGRSSEWVTLHCIIPGTGPHELPCDPATCAAGPDDHPAFFDFLTHELAHEPDKGCGESYAAAALQRLESPLRS